MLDAPTQDWWGDPRCHFGLLKDDSPILTQQEDIRPAIEFICTELALPAGARILDLCCGPGRYAIELAHKGFTVVGIDLNEDRIDKDVIPAKQVGMKTIRIRVGLHKNQQPRIPLEIPDAELDGISGLAAAVRKVAKQGSELL